MNGDLIPESQPSTLAKAPPFLGLDASKFNSVYSGSKLQPSALQLLACIRV